MIYFRPHLLIRGNQTNNYAEAGIKILKEIIFSYVNVIEMVFLLLTQWIYIISIGYYTLLTTILIDI